MSFLGRVISRFGGAKKEVPKDPRQFVAQADDARRAGLFSEAIIILEQGLETNPTYVAAHVALGRVFQQTFQYDRALESYQVALRYDRENLVAIRQLADVYLAVGEKVEAIKKLKLFRGLKPGDREVQELIDKLDAELNPPGARQAPAPPPPSAVFFEQVARAPATAPVEPLAPSAGRRETPPDWSDVAESPSAAPETSLVAMDFVSPEAPADTPPPAPVPAPLPDVPEPQSPPVAARPLRDDLRVLEEGPTMAMSILELLGPLQKAEESDEADEADEGAPAPAMAAAAPAAPEVTLTLAELYERQGYTEDAEKAYRALAAEALDPDSERELRARAERLRSTPAATPDSGPRRLRAFLERLPRREEARITDLGTVLEELVSKDESILAATLTDLEGLPVVTAGRAAESAELEVLIAELTTFWKGIDRTNDEVGAGPLRTLAFSAQHGAALVSAVTSDYALILQLGSRASLGRARFEAMRAAERLRPALG